MENLPIKSINKLEKTKLFKLLENNGFGVFFYTHDNKTYAETSYHTNGGIELCENFEFNKEGFIEAAHNFDVDSEVMLHYQDKRFRDAFTLREAIEEMMEYENKLETIKSHL